jgi:pimeloyl-ACP methyl ester carboxylesterase
MPSSYGDAYVITRELIEDGRKHLILDQDIDVGYPVHILHGSDDPDVPWQHGFELFNRIVGDDVGFTLIKNGDHRLSTARDIRIIVDMVESVIRATL